MGIAETDPGDAISLLTDIFDFDVERVTLPDRPVWMVTSLSRVGLSSVLDAVEAEYRHSVDLVMPKFFDS